MTARGPLPGTSLLICSRDRPQLLRETIQSVLEGNRAPAEIVVVDQSHRAQEDLWGLVAGASSRLHYIHSATRGLSRARNEAIAAAQYEVLIILDDDMLVERNWLETLVAALQAGGPRAVVTGSVLPDPAAGSRGFVPALVTSPQPGEYAGRLDRDVLAGGHMAAYRSALLLDGGFDERLGAGSAFPAADDNDLGFRLLEQGFRIVYVPAAVVYHRAWRPEREYLPMRWRYGRGKGGFYAKYGFTRGGRCQAAHMRKRLFRDIGRRVAGFPRRLLNDPRGAVGDVVYSAGVIRGVVQWMLTT